jgi:hypothetical protein
MRLLVWLLVALFVWDAWRQIKTTGEWSPLKITWRPNDH